ncbi:hypothetical protein Q7P35_011595 [Cladosporium inversicolor]
MAVNAARPGNSKCPGYAPQLKWSRKHEKYDQSSNTQEPKAKARRKDDPKQAPDQSKDAPVVSATQVQTVEHEENNTTGPESAPTWPPNQLDFDPAMLDWMDYGMPTFEPFASNNMAQMYGPSQTPFAPYHPLSGLTGPETGPMHGGLDPYGFSPLGVPRNHLATGIPGIDTSLPDHVTNAPANTPNDGGKNVKTASMAIAHLSNHYLYMAPFGRMKRMQSWKSLQIDLRRYRAGLSSPWHQPSDLGLQYLFIARSLIQMYLRSNRRTSITLPNEKFYLDAFMHWEMLASFFEPVAMMSFPGFGAPNPPMPVRGEMVSPHPWTGIAPELHFALAEVGRVLRRRRSRLAMMGDPPTEERSQTDEIDEQWSSSLERLLQTIRLPDLGDIEEYGDKYTPKMDLLRAAEAYRFVGMLELYMIVPNLLEARIERGESFPASNVEDFDEPADDSGFLENRDSWLSAIALHTLQLIKVVSIHSATCRMHLLILVSAGSQLRLPSTTIPLDDSANPHHDKVLEGRGFVDSRMLALSRKYPQKQVLQILDIIKEAWDRLDRGEKRVHWLGVAHEQNWQTMLG